MRQPKTLVIGHSHVNCIAVAAIKFGPFSWLRAVNLRKFAKETTQTNALGLSDHMTALARKIRAECQGFAPDIVYVCLGGNFHNVIGLLEHPQPFWTGPDPQGRRAIPKALLLDLFRERANVALMSRIFEAFPKADRVVLNAPPPIANFDHIKRHPGVFADRIGQGPAPKELRRRLYNLQSEVMATLAEEHGAAFLAVPDHLMDAEGFLAPQYVDRDPTHGNASYGLELLRCFEAREEPVQ